MNTRVILVLLVLMAMLFAALYFGGSSVVPELRGTTETTVEDAPHIGKRAPEFDLPDLAGDHKRISDWNGQPLIVLFWATWNAEAADQLKILDDYTVGGLANVVAIASQEEKSVVSSFTRRGGYTVPILLDERGGATEAYDVRSLPTIFFVNREGIIVDVHAGILSERMIGDKAERILR